jgi:hypothetical protein
VFNEYTVAALLELADLDPAKFGRMRGTANYIKIILDSWTFMKAKLQCCNSMHSHNGEVLRMAS